MYFSTSQQMINMIAPHLLPDEDGNEVSNMSRDDEEYPVSSLDPSVFRSRSRAYRKAEDWEVRAEHFYGFYTVCVSRVQDIDTLVNFAIDNCPYITG